MKYLKIYSTLLFTAGLLTACDGDSVENVTFDVTVANNLNEIYVGDEVKFDFSGNPDYIIFYSGDEKNSYENKDRQRIDVSSMEFACTIKQQYNDKDFQNKQIVSLKISEDFNGDYSKVGIDKATWTELTTITGEIGKIPAPKPTGTGAVTTNGTLDLKSYIGKKFYLAVNYATPAYENPTSYTSQPRVDITPISLLRTAPDGKKYPLSNPEGDLGFAPVFVSSTTMSNYTVDASTILLQPKDEHKEPLDIWMISRPIDAYSIDPDKGMPIKTVDAKLPSYSYIYTTPGTYKVVFIARNANMWNSSELLREVTFEVKAKKGN